MPRLWDICWEEGISPFTTLYVPPKRWVIALQRHDKHAGLHQSEALTHHKCMVSGRSLSLAWLLGGGLQAAGNQLPASVLNFHQMFTYHHPPCHDYPFVYLELLLPFKCCFCERPRCRSLGTSLHQGQGINASRLAAVPQMLDISSFHARFFWNGHSCACPGPPLLLADYLQSQCSVPAIVVLRQICTGMDI